MQALGNNKDAIIERIYIHTWLKIASPCLIGSGDNIFTDIDVIRDNLGTPFIPGSSIAGVLRNYVNSKERYDSEDVEVGYLFGDRIKENNNINEMSSIFISDGIFKKDTIKIIQRDGVELSSWKTAKTGSKYNYELIEQGAMFPLKIEVVIRVKHNPELLKKKLYKIISGLINGEVSIGAKTKKGFGKLIILEESIKILRLDFKNKDNSQITLNSWLNFNWDTFMGNINYKDLVSEEYKEMQRFITVKAGFNIKNSIMIRTYSTDIDDVDYEHIKSNNNPIIPGTTWSGIILSQAKLLLKELGKDSNWLDEIFGYVDKENKEASASIVKIEESVIYNSKPLTQSRVKIDRFSGGAVNSALFNEKPEYKGQVQLIIKINKDESVDYQAFIGLLILVLKDISNGILPVGGETAIGRGILENTSDKFVIIDNQHCDSECEKIYLDALAKFS